MGMLDGEYWVVFSGGLMGVSTDGDRIEQILKDAYVADQQLPAEEREKLDIRIKFDEVRLTYRGRDVTSYYAVNTQGL